MTAAEVTFSVAMCTYNGERYVAQQLQSILQQSLAPAELVICDDGSSDNTVAIVEEALAGTDIASRVIRNPQNLGVVKNFEQAIADCSGSHIVLADQDDLWHPDRLAVTAEAIARQQGEPALYYFEPEIIDAAGTTQPKRFWQRAGIHLNAQPLWKTLAVRNVVPGCCIAFDARLRNRALPFPSEAIMHDWWLNLVAATSAEVVDLKRPLLAYRLHDDNEEGVNSLSKSAAQLREHSATTIVTDNLRATLQQCRAVQRRIGSNDKVGLGEYLGLFDRPLLQRLQALAKLGVHPASFVKKLQMFYAASRVTAADIDGPAAQYR